VALDAPLDPGVLSSHPARADVVYGGEIADRRLAVGREMWSLRLPRPLAAGEEHEYSLIFSSYPQECMSPQHIFTPAGRCNALLAAVRFDRSALPRRVWRLDGTPSGSPGDTNPARELRPDPVGEVTAAFYDLQASRSYGFRWQP
jgi:hypothetical protein